MGRAGSAGSGRACARRERTSRRLEFCPRLALASGLLRACLLAGLALGVVVPSPVHAQTEVPADWALTPSGLSAGDTFRLIFATRAKRRANAEDIADYNTFVQTAAAAGHSAIQSHSAGFRVVGCTAGVDARDNTATTYTSSDKGVPVYWLGGNKVADDYEDFYDGSWDDEANPKDEAGSNRSLRQVGNQPWTGCDHDGTESISGTTSYALGRQYSLCQSGCSEQHPRGERTDQRRRDSYSEFKSDALRAVGSVQGARPQHGCDRRARDHGGAAGRADADGGRRHDGRPRRPADVGVPRGLQLPVGAGVHSSQRLVTVPLRLQPPVQVLKIRLKCLPVFLLAHPIHPHRRVRTQTMKGTLRRRHVKQMRQ